MMMPNLPDSSTKFIEDIFHDLYHFNIYIFQFELPLLISGQKIAFVFENPYNE